MLANIYMRRFVLDGRRSASAKPRHAARDRRRRPDPRQEAAKAGSRLGSLREIMGKLKLTVNEGKTRVCTVPGEEFDSGIHVR